MTNNEHSMLADCILVSINN